MIPRRSKPRRILPGSMATLPGRRVTPKFAPRRPPSRVRPGQSKRIGSGPDRLSPHRSSSLRCAATNRDTYRWRSATPIQTARAPSVMSSWTRRLERPPRPGAFAPRPNPPGTWRTTRQSRVEPPPPERACSREARRQTPCLRRPPGFQGRRSPSPAKGSAIGRTQGAFHQRELPEGLNLARQAETDPDRPEVRSCPQVVPILWRRTSRLFCPAQDPALTSRVEQGPGHWRQSAR